MLKIFSNETYAELELQVIFQYYLYGWNAIVRKGRTVDGGEILKMAEYHLVPIGLRKHAVYYDYYAGCYEVVNVNDV